MPLKPILTFFLIIVLIGCTSQEKKYRFVQVDAAKSRIDFVNQITENDTINVIDFQYVYNGGGVGIGDFNNDGLSDIVFTGNQVSSRLYLNQGNLKFKDVTENAGVNTKSWVTGVNVVDINADGLEDIYLNVAGPDCKQDCTNLLFVNQGLDDQGIPKFKEQAVAYGLDDGNYSQQSIFFDYDSDGDLDVFILHNGNHGFDKNNPLPKRYLEPHLKDLLLRNDSVPGLEHPYFTDISKSSGIVHGGFGLGIGINDINNDGLTDIYVANDFITEDLLYIQKRHPDSLAPWFEDGIKDYIGHASHNAMGMDFADVNNDALPDILVVDMLPEKYERQKRMLGSMNYERYLLALRNDYGSQYVRNTLQLNNGSIDGKLLKTSEVGFISGIASTDWSWAPLLVDLDNDGDRDIYISNGYVKDVADLDYINYASENNMFGSTDERMKKQKEFATKLKSIHLANYIFENKGHLTTGGAGLNFDDVSISWTKSVPTFTNGVVYADLDQDGDLDLVLNNINEPAMVLENKTSDDPKKNFIRIKLKGLPKNPMGIGSKIRLWSNGEVQEHFQSVVRGYLSSVEPIVHFGVTAPKLDSLEVRWPNGKTSFLKDVKSGQVLEVEIKKARDVPQIAEKMGPYKLFVKMEGLLDYVHKENRFNEYAIQPLLMRQYSRMGPCIAVGNIDSKIGDEIFIGGSKGMAGEIWFQGEDGMYRPQQELDPDFEDTDAVFVDVDGDKDLDLYVTSGGSEFGQNSEKYNDRVYLNDGTGYFERNENALSIATESTQIVRPADIDNDGDMDFFIGARIVPGKYPTVPKSKILVNENGRLTEMETGGIGAIGMVTDALWEDMDKDGLLDLVVVGEWMPITVFKNDKTKFSPMPAQWVDENNNAMETTGWWNCIAKADFDKDGDVDFLLGNQGLNWVLSPTQSHPVYVYKKDYDKNGSPDPVVGKYFPVKEDKKLLPLHSRDDIVAQLPILKRKYLRYDDFTKVSFEQLLNIKDLESETLNAKIFASSYAENLGNGKFRLVPLPLECQVAPINDILVNDFDQDGQYDALLVGNDFSSEAIYGRADALTGLLLKGNKGYFEVMPSKDSGFYVPGQSNHLTFLTDKNGRRIILATQNNDSLFILPTSITLGLK